MRWCRMVQVDTKKPRLAGLCGWARYWVLRDVFLLDVLNLLTHLLNQHFQLDAATGDFSIDGF